MVEDMMMQRHPRYEEGKEATESERAKLETSESSSSLSSMIHDIAAFRDFFLASFSDGCHNAFSCGDPCCGSSKSDKRFEDDYSLRPSRSGASHDSLQLSPSQEARRPNGRRRKPLAVAVGLKYAEDLHGRPIVITPTNSRTDTSFSSESKISPPRSPPSVPRLRNPGDGLPTMEARTKGTLAMKPTTTPPVKDLLSG